MTDFITPTQADRDAAANHLLSLGQSDCGSMRSGMLDGHGLVQAFARHRVSHSLPVVVGMRWRPILRFGDMPLDGTWFAARCTAPGYSAVRIVHYADRRDRLPIDHSGWVWPSVPTEWMPLDEFAAALTPSPCPGDVGTVEGIKAHIERYAVHDDARRIYSTAQLETAIRLALINRSVCPSDVGALRELVHESLFHLRLDDAAKAYHDKALAALTPSALSGDAGEGEPWPGCHADLQQRRVIALAKAGLMLSRMAADDVSEAFGQDPADLLAEVLMALAIEDTEDTDIALEVARDHPDGDCLAAHCVGATGPWMKVGTFDPEPDALYLVQGLLRTSVKRGSEIQGDNVAAALIAALPSRRGAE